MLLRRTRRADEPVYRRLPDGRIRFAWSVHTALGTARHPQTGPVPAGDPRPGRYRTFHT